MVLQIKLRRNVCFLDTARLAWRSSLLCPMFELGSPKFFFPLRHLVSFFDLLLRCISSLGYHYVDVRLHDRHQTDDIKKRPDYQWFLRSPNTNVDGVPASINTQE